VTPPALQPSMYRQKDAEHQESDEGFREQCPSSRGTTSYARTGNRPQVKHAAKGTAPEPRTPCASAGTTSQNRDLLPGCDNVDVNTKPPGGVVKVIQYDSEPKACLFNFVLTGCSAPRTSYKLKHHRTNQV